MGTKRMRFEPIPCWLNDCRRNSLFAFFLCPSQTKGWRENILTPNCTFAKNLSNQVDERFMNDWGAEIPCRLRYSGCEPSPDKFPFHKGHVYAKIFVHTILFISISDSLELSLKVILKDFKAWI